LPALAVGQQEGRNPGTEPPRFTGPPGGPDAQANPQAPEEASPRQSDKLLSHCRQKTGTNSVVVEGTGNGADRRGGNCA